MMSTCTSTVVPLPAFPTPIPEEVATNRAYLYERSWTRDLEIELMFLPYDDEDTEEQEEHEGKTDE